MFLDNRQSVTADAIGRDVGSMIIEIRDARLEFINVALMHASTGFQIVSKLTFHTIDEKFLCYEYST